MDMAKEDENALELDKIIKSAQDAQHRSLTRQLNHLRLNNTTHNVLVIFDSKRAYRDCEVSETTFTYDGQKNSTAYDTDMTDPGYPKILIKKQSGKHIFIGRVIVNERFARDKNRAEDPQPSYILRKNLHGNNHINLLPQVIKNISTLTTYNLKLKVLLMHGIIPDNSQQLDEGVVKCKMVG